MISRRRFFARAAQGLGVSLILPSLQTCQTTSSFKGKVMGPNSDLGHRLRTMDFSAPEVTIVTDTLIIGGGVAGLSAARYLKKFTNDFLLVELEENPGGNAIAGSNNVSSFPWGAHYLPLPGTNDIELIDFLKEVDVITGSNNGLPTFNEYYLCHDPKERLYINHYWQEGIIPHEGIHAAQREEIDRFLFMMNDYKHLKGKDQRDAFAIPIAYSSQDKEITDLDKITAKQFLDEHHFYSPFLIWYVNYCCADDYGSSLDQTSAWAMIHYFASRKGSAANASSDAVLTWPEGNYWLVKQLKETIKDNILSNTLVYDVNIKNAQVEVLVFDASTNSSKRIVAKSVIMATPQFINQHLLKSQVRDIDYSHFQYAPWMVANLTVNTSLNEKQGERLCWDNVIYGSDSVGYVNALHQQIGVHGEEKVITFYKPLLGNPSELRKHAMAKTFKDWKTDVLSDLKGPHADIEKNIQAMDVWVWGHGMIKPSPGFIWGKSRTNANSAIGNRIYFAHSDISGISIFEEAFYQGHKSAKAVLKHV